MSLLCVRYVRVISIYYLSFCLLLKLFLYYLLCVYSFLLSNILIRTSYLIIVFEHFLFNPIGIFLVQKISNATINFIYPHLIMCFISFLNPLSMCRTNFKYLKLSTSFTSLPLIFITCLFCSLRVHFLKNHTLYIYMLCLSLLILNHSLSRASFHSSSLPLTSIEFPPTITKSVSSMHLNTPTINSLLFHPFPKKINKDL